MTGFLTELFALDGRVAVVTGGSSGIGEAMASAMALAGAKVVLVARDPTRLSATASPLCEAGCAAAWVSADLSDRAEVRRGASAATAALGEPDILVNCAGVNLRPPLAALTRSQSEAWASSGVCVNSVCPGFVPTPLNAAVASDPVRSAALAARTMLGRNGEPSDFAGVTVFLASAASDYITGQTIYVDSGFSVT